MGMCEYCGKRPAEFEIVDGNQDSGVAMVCPPCHPNQKFVINESATRIMFKSS